MSEGELTNKYGWRMNVKRYEGELKRQVEEETFDCEGEDHVEHDAVFKILEEAKQDMLHTDDFGRIEVDLRKFLKWFGGDSK